MKKLVLLFLLTVTISMQCQTIEPAPKDKAVVYFVRASSLGAMINFTYFDSTKVIGKFNGPKLLRYECEPGEHLFWARSENKDFVKTYLEAGKIYVVDVIPVMGAIKAGVSLVLIDSNDYKMKRIQKLLTRRSSESFSEKQLDNLQKQMASVILRGLDKAMSLGDDIELVMGVAFQPEELKFVKKKKSK